MALLYTFFRSGWYKHVVLINGNKFSIYRATSLVRIKFCFGLTMYNKCSQTFRSFMVLVLKLHSYYKHSENDSICVCGIQTLGEDMHIKYTVDLNYLRVSGHITKQRLQHSKITFSSNAFIHTLERCNKKPAKSLLKNASIGSFSYPWIGGTG